MSLDKEILICLDKTENTDKYLRVYIDENFVDKESILCFIPDRDIPLKTNFNFCFIPYSRSKDWEYKNNSRAIHYKLGQENCDIIETDVTYPIHRKIGLLHSQEVSILLLVIQYLLDNNEKVNISRQPDLKDKELQYFNKLLQENKVKILNENNR